MCRRRASLLFCEVPIAAYGAETWTLTKKDISSLQAGAMRFLCRLVKVMRMDRIENETNSDKLRVEALQNTVE